MYKLNLLTKKILPAMAAILIFSCAGNEEKKDEIKQPQATDTVSTIPVSAGDIVDNCDYYITETDGRNMIDKFINTYPTLSNSAGNKLTHEFWIDSCELSSLINFFNTNGANCDGVRFCFINNKNSGLAIIPTVPSLTPSATSQHTDRPDLKIKDLCSAITKYLNIADHQNKMNVFGSKFRKEATIGDRKSAKIDSLSASVWYSKCVMLKLAKLVTDKANNLNGITAFCAAHLKIEANAIKLGQVYPYQSSLIFVPTYGVSHLPNWDIVMPPPSIDKSVYKTLSGGFNHGQLCPQICD